MSVSYDICALLYLSPCGFVLFWFFGFVLCFVLFCFICLFVVLFNHIIDRTMLYDIDRHIV